MPIQDCAMLANLAISQWTARKHDKTVSAEVEAKHNATNAGRFNKLLIDKEALDPIAKVATGARLHHYKVTLPWGDNGDRLLPAKLYFDYTSTMQQFKTEFETRVRVLARDYPQLVQDARRRLGTMYEPRDYPADIQGRFSLSTSFTPVPDARDFRVDVGAEDMARIRTEITTMNQDRVNAALQDCWSRVRDVVERFAERLGDEKAIFRNSMVENARELLQILPALNITNDPALDDAAKDIERLLVYSPDTLRDDTRKRAEIAAAASATLAKFPWTSTLESSTTG